MNTLNLIFTPPQIKFFIYDIPSAYEVPTAKDLFSIEKEINEFLQDAVQEVIRLDIQRFFNDLRYIYILTYIPKTTERIFK